jgi:hypothetical protein
MDNKNLRKTDLTTDNVQRLRQLITKLTVGVVITEKDADLREIQELQRQRLLEDIGVLFVHSPSDRAISSLWDLLESHLSAEKTLSQEALGHYREQLSKPLIGQPSEVLKMAGFGQQGHPLNKIVNNLRHTMTPLQQQLLPQVTERLV